MDNQFAADFGVTEKWRSRRLNRRCTFCVYSKRSNDKVQNTFTWNCLCKDKSIIIHKMNLAIFDIFHL